MSTIKADLAFINASVEVLEDYLLSSELFWPLSIPRQVAATTGFSRLSLGALLLSMARIPLQETEQTQPVFLKISQIKQHWLSHWRQKAEKEFSSRMMLWSNYLDELIQDRSSAPTGYAQEVRWRVMLALLINETDSPPAIRVQQLAILDARLSQNFYPGQFIWSDDLKSAFPEKSYWFLYGQPE